MQLSRSNGGTLTANVYAGIPSSDIAKVVAYKAARARLGLPEVRILRMPVERFTWGTLAETVRTGGTNQGVGIPPFRNIAGGGNFEGATINADLTVDGARTFALAPRPFIMPVYIKGTTIKKYPSFEARLVCDFRTGWYMRGRADVKDGLIIYNNDVTMGFDVGGTASSGPPCTVTFAGGGAPSNEVREAAIRKAFMAIQARMGETFLQRSNLAMEDRRAYFQHVVSDIQANRYQGRRQPWMGFVSFFTGGFLGGLINSVSRASSFYWHTDIQDIRHTDALHWEQVIRDNGNTSVEIDLPTSICLAYNPDRKIYLACSEKELDQSASMTGARQDAQSSPTCSGEMTSTECGAQRSESAPRNPDTGNIAPLSL